MFGEVYILALICANTFGASVSLDDQQDRPLILTPLIENGEAAKARVLSTVDPSLFAGVNSHAAYITVNKTGKWNLFFWYFPVSLVPVEDRPLIIWLQGGPGSSSLYGLFNEIGPIRLNQDTVEKMPITWGSDYSLVFIDNPVGTGFSFTEGGEYTTNEDEVGACLLNFLQQFFQVFPEMRKASLFIAGESYAGKYIPAFGHYILHNQNKSVPINLKGLAIGDGWTDPPTLLHNAAWALQVGLIDPETAVLINDAEERTRQLWDEHDFTAYKKSFNDVRILLDVFIPINVYNFLKDKYQNIDNHIEKFLNKPEVQTALHVKKTWYTMQNYKVYESMQYEFYDSVKPWLEELLEHYGVLCYNGQLDMIVAYALSVHTYRSLKWSGAQAYRNATRLPIYDPAVFGKINFYLKNYGNFFDVMVRGAGHMVPEDKPHEAKQMIDMFIKNFNK